MKDFVLATAATLAILLAVASANRLQAQATTAPAQPSSAVAFEAASVKANMAGDNLNLFQMTPGRVTATGAPRAELVRFAFQIQPVRIIGLPDWSRADRFDIVGKLEGTPDPGSVNAAMRALLAERFKLTTHTETRELPIYALIKAKGDGALGPQLRPAAVDCASRRGAPPPGGRAGGPPATPGLVD
jgi:uncharacterized protein (TIGR03435 family)